MLSSSCLNADRFPGYKPESIKRTWERNEVHLDTITGVRVAKPLNDKGIHLMPNISTYGALIFTSDWEKIAPKIIAYCHEHLVKQRADTFTSVYQLHISSRPQVNEIAPRAPDLAIAKMEPFRGLIHDSPATHAVTEVDFKQHLHKVPELTKTWREHADATLVDLVRQSWTAEPSGKGKAADLNPSVLSLAATVFRCKRCLQPLFYPSLLTHHCNIHPYVSSASALNDVRSRGALDEVEYSPVTASYAMAVVTALGKDPTMVTADEMDQYNQRAECVRCRRDLRIPRRFFMTWRRAVCTALRRAHLVTID